MHPIRAKMNAERDSILAHYGLQVGQQVEISQGRGVIRHARKEEHRNGIDDSVDVAIPTGDDGRAKTYSVLAHCVKPIQA